MYLFLFCKFYGSNSSVIFLFCCLVEVDLLSLKAFGIRQRFLFWQFIIFKSSTVKQIECVCVNDS